MDWKSVNFDWNRARAFLVTAEEGSLSAAARALHMTQPTLGRQVSALEEELGVALFERRGQGLELTPSGLELVEHVRSMGEAASRVSLTASGQSQSIEGSICVTATEVGSYFLLPPILAQLREAHPGITVEVAATNSIRDLRRREADIALRSARPTDPSLIARRLPDAVARLYATPDCLARYGEIKTNEDLSRALFIGFEENELFLEGMNGLGLSLTSESFKVLCGNHLVQWEMVKQGMGIGVMLEQVGEAEPLVVEAAPWLSGFNIEVWLVAHRELKNNRRVRLVFDWLFDALERL
ncbi:MAG: LysR family transcriptional regulator [Pseudomonadota bacterium]